MLGASMGVSKPQMDWQKILRSVNLRNLIDGNSLLVVTVEREKRISRKIPEAKHYIA